MTRRLLAVLLTLAALLSACGDDEEKSGSSSGSGTKTEEGPRSEADLQAALLTQAEVPPGLTLQPAEEDDEEEEAAGTGCFEQDPDDKVPPAAKAGADFASEDGYRTVTHEVRSYEEGKAAESMDEGRRLIEACRTIKESSEGTTFTGTMKDLDFPDLGDDTVAVTIEATAGDVSVTADLVVIRTGEVTTAIGNLVVAGNVDHALTESLVRKALAKLG